MSKKRSNRLKRKTKRLYTFLLKGSFTVQFTFTDSEVVRHTSGVVRPSNQTLRELRKEFRDHLGESYAVESVGIQADGDDFIDESTVEVETKSHRRKVR